MSRFAHQAEILKLARFLDVEQSELSMLETVPYRDIRILREKATEHFFASDGGLFGRLGKAGGLMPISMLATIAEKVLGPVLSGRVAGQMDVERGVAISEKLPIPFLADLCLSLDPKQADDLVRAMPSNKIREIAKELNKRREYVTMARFVAVMRPETTKGVIEVLDNEGLLHVSFFIEEQDDLEKTLALIPEKRLVEVIESTAKQEALWSDALALMEHVGNDWKARLGNLAAGLDQSILDSMIRTVDKDNLWSIALSVFCCMDKERQERFATLDIFKQQAVIDRVIQAAAKENLWKDLLEVINMMEPEAQKCVANASEQLEQSEVDDLAQAASSAGKWESLLLLAGLMDEGAQNALIQKLSKAPSDTLSNLPAANDYPIVEKIKNPA